MINSATVTDNTALEIANRNRILSYDLDPNDNALNLATSNYYTVASAKTLFDNVSRYSLSLLHLNIRSLNKNIDQFSIL